jgi:hypothetical protein
VRRKERGKRLSRQVPHVRGIGGAKSAGLQHGAIQHLHVNFLPPGDRHQPRHRLPLGLFHLHAQVLVQSARGWGHPNGILIAVANVSQNDSARQDAITQWLAAQTQRRARAKGVGRVERGGTPPPQRARTCCRSASFCCASSWIASELCVH